MSEQKNRPDQDARKEKEIKEPFRPEDTPRPPQVMDTSKDPDEQDKENNETSRKPRDEKKDSR